MALRTVAADACVLINLLATRRPAEILDALGWSLVTTTQAAAQVKNLAGPPDDDGRPTREPADVSSLVDSRRLEVLSLPPQILELFIKLAGEIHEADASCIALAIGMGVPVATDDALARSIAARVAPTLEMPRTLEIVKRAAEVLGLSGKGLVAMVLDLRRRGNFAPPRNDPDRDWYAKLLGP